jgi:hypothetical protein
MVNTASDGREVGPVVHTRAPRAAQRPPQVWRSGARAAVVRQRMRDVDREQLPTVAEARELAREAIDAAGEDGGVTILTRDPQPQGDAAPETPALTPAQQEEARQRRAEGKHRARAVAR